MFWLGVLDWCEVLGASWRDRDGDDDPLLSRDGGAPSKGICGRGLRGCLLLSCADFRSCCFFSGLGGLLVGERDIYIALR